MMAGNPTNWWSIMVNAGGTMHPPQQPSLSSSSSSSYQLLPPSSPPSHQHFYGPNSNSFPENPSQDFPRSWSQLLLEGLGGTENEKFGMSPFRYEKVNWQEDENNNPSSSSSTPALAPVSADVIKQEHHFPLIGHMYGYNNHNTLPLVLENINDLHHHRYFQTNAPTRPHHHQEFASSSPCSCVTTTFRDNNTNNVSLIFSGNHNRTDKPPEVITQRAHQHFSECNSTSTSNGGASNKKARVHHSSTQPSLKVRKEKLGDRITALHQLVSPFGKTDTASVLSEAIGYIRFLHAQIQALSSPYLGSAPGSMGHIHQQSESENGGKDLRSRGLCLVPLSCTQHVSVGSDVINGADYWAAPPPALGGGF